MEGGRTLTVFLDSSITSGVAALVLDIFLLQFIKFHLQLICSSANLYLVYDRRAAISPTRSFFSSLTGGPVGPRRLVRFFSVLLAILTTCVVVLGFSINGKTIDVFEPEKFKSFVQIEERKPANISYDREIERRPSRDGSDEKVVFISRRLAAMSDSFACQINDYDHAQIFAIGFKDLDLNFELVEQRKKLKAGECITTPTFRESVVSRAYKTQPQARLLSCDIDRVKPSFVDPTTKTGSATIQTENCELSLTELQCYRDEGKTACAEMSQAVESTDTFVLLIPDISSPKKYELAQVGNKLAEVEQRKLEMNVAFLSTAGFGGGVANLANIAITSVTHNKTLYKRSTNRKQVSEIDLTIAVPLLTVVGLVTVLLSFSSVLIWLVVVYRKGRAGYNKFTTVFDALELANCSMQNKSRFRTTKKGDIFIGVARASPELLIVGGEERELCNNSSWKEDEIPKSAASDL